MRVCQFRHIRTFDEVTLFSETGRLLVKSWKQYGLPPRQAIRSLFRHLAAARSSRIRRITISSIWAAT
jgi:hypothetical protein